MQAIGNYSSSSSFKVGVLFTSLLMLGVFVIIYFMVLVKDQALIKETEAAINADMQSFHEAETLSGIQFVHEKLQFRLNVANNSFFYVLNTPQGKLELANIPAWPQGSVEPVEDGIFKFEVTHEDVANAKKVLTR